MPSISLEFFPPKNPKGEQDLWNTAQSLARFSPEFVSVTSSAGGSLTDNTQTIKQLHAQGLAVAPHITCRNVDPDELLSLCEAYIQIGITHIVALRGDDEQENRRLTNNAPNIGFNDTRELVRALRAYDQLTIHVSAYPEQHPLAESPKQDVLWLGKKFACGADRAITQFFYQADDYFRFQDQVTALGYDQPIVPGILPIHNIQAIERFAQLCKTSLPAALSSRFHNAKSADDAQKIAIEHATELCEKLLAGGAPSLHFYTLNRAELTEAICDNLAIGQAPQRKTA